MRGSINLIDMIDFLKIYQLIILEIGFKETVRDGDSNATSTAYTAFTAYFSKTAFTALNQKGIYDYYI